MTLRCGIRLTIIGWLLLALTGCSALRVAYSTGPQISWWWIDGYFDFSREQRPAVQGAIERWFDWHRSTQLPDYVALLGVAQRQVPEPMTSGVACRWNSEIRELLAPALDRALVQAAELLPGLAEPQLRHLERRYQKNLEEVRLEFLQPEPAVRLQASLKRAVGRAEQVYGKLDEAQRRLIGEGLAASPFDPQAWFDERGRRQRDTLQTLRQLLAGGADTGQRVAALRALLERSSRSPDAPYRALQHRLTDYNCAFVARLHNTTTPAQRRHARETFKGWADDLSALMSPAGGN